MEQSLAQTMQLRQAQSLKQMQRLMMSPQMQQALVLMQMPILELAGRLEQELIENPLLEHASESAEEELEKEIAEENRDDDISPEQELCFDDKEFEILKKLDEEFKEQFDESNIYVTKNSDTEKLLTFMESSLPAATTQFEYLMLQARETFEKDEEIAMAEALIGNLDHSGYLNTPLSEIALLGNFNEERLYNALKKIQFFDPVGIAARNLQESLLIQLTALGKQDSLAYHIVANTYEEMLHNRIPQIQKALGCTAAAAHQAICEEISRLDLHPASLLSTTPIQPITPDVTIAQDGEQLTVIVNEEHLSPIRLNRRYMNMLDDEQLPQETKDFIKKKVLSAKWFLHNIHQRHDTLERIAIALTKLQRDFLLDPTGKLSPMSMKNLAQELHLHESTIARAVANKYLDCPRGLIPLRSLFTNAYMTHKGANISANTVWEELSNLIAQENKLDPLSDEEISKALYAKGITCARRTVAKYRAKLNIANAHQRRKFI